MSLKVHQTPKHFLLLHHNTSYMFMIMEFWSICRNVRIPKFTYDTFYYLHHTVKFNVVFNSMGLFFCYFRVFNTLKCLKRISKLDIIWMPLWTHWNIELTYKALKSKSHLIFTSTNSSQKVAYVLIIARSCQLLKTKLLSNKKSN